MRSQRGEKDREPGSRGLDSCEGIVMRLGDDKGRKQNSGELCVSQEEWILRMEDGLCKGGRGVLREQSFLLAADSDYMVK